MWRVKVEMRNKKGGRKREKLSWMGRDGDRIETGGMNKRRNRGGGNESEGDRRLEGINDCKEEREIRKQDNEGE